MDTVSVTSDVPNTSGTATVHDKPADHRFAIRTGTDEEPP